jgi:hypothetical protein
MNYTFSLSEQEANVIMNALQELPFKVSAALIQKLMEQAQAQAKSEAPVDKSE